MRKLLAMIAALLLSLTMMSSPASAATNVKVSGEVTCLNSSVVGVWIQGETSKSGWAAWKVPVKVGGHSKATYSYTLNKGGRYQVHAGCGGSSKSWKVNAKSGYVKGTKNNFKCNDISPAVAAAGKKLFKVDLTQGVAYKTCKKV